MSDYRLRCPGARLPTQSLPLAAASTLVIIHKLSRPSWLERYRNRGQEPPEKAKTLFHNHVHSLSRYVDDWFGDADSRFPPWRILPAIIHAILHLTRLIDLLLPLLSTTSIRVPKWLSRP